MKLNKYIENNLKEYNTLKVKLKNVNLDLELNEDDLINQNIKRDIETKIKNIDRVIFGLPYIERNIIELKYFNKLNWKEIIEITGLSYSYVMELRTKTINNMDI